MRGALARAFKTNTLDVPADLPELIATQLERAALDPLGLEAKAGHLLTGGEKIETAARSGKLHLLLHAADAGADGVGKLAQAWRVGRDQEGSGLKGLALPVPRTTLALALGRENVVHIGLTDRAAAARVSETLDRWLHFIGPNPDPYLAKPLRKAHRRPANCATRTPASRTRKTSERDRQRKAEARHARATPACAARSRPAR